MPRRNNSLLASPLHLLHSACQRADKLFSQHVADAPITPRQWAVLQAVATEAGLSQTAIMAATGIDRSSTTDLVRRLVSNGCLERRRRRRDARTYAVRLTPKGRQMLAVGQPAAQMADEALMSSLAPAQRANFIRALLAIVQDTPRNNP